MWPDEIVFCFLRGELNNQHAGMGFDTSRHREWGGLSETRVPSWFPNLLTIHFGSPAMEGKLASWLL